MAKVKATADGGVDGFNKTIGGPRKKKDPQSSAFKKAAPLGGEPKPQQGGFLGRSMVDQMSQIKQKTQTMINKPTFRIPRVK